MEIIHQLATQVLIYEEHLIAASDLCGEFDAISALAMGAERYQWKAPRIMSENIIRIEGGRHPLQELVVPAFVSNNCYLSGGSDSSVGPSSDQPQALVLSGPNHSGKSVYIKQTAIIVYLAHIGSFVPAERAEIGLTDKILTRISTRESASRIESAFAIDLAQVARAVQAATPRSLVLIDEFGKGSNLDDGAGLLAALIDHFLSRGSHMPRFLLATHFHELFEGDYFHENEKLRLAHMDVRTNWTADQAEDQITYLFKLTDGHSSSSFGAKCAALNGVPSSVVQCSEAISQLLAQGENLSSAYEKLSAHQEKELEVAERVARIFLSTDLDAIDGSGEGFSVRRLLEGLVPSQL